jgi:predicted HTH domain antitoxin
MATIHIELPEELIRAAKVSAKTASEDIAKILTLELFRERTISMGKAAELCGLSVEEFMAFASRREVPLHYELEDLENDRKLADSLKL